MWIEHVNKWGWSHWSVRSGDLYCSKNGSWVSDIWPLLEQCKFQCLWLAHMDNVAWWPIKTYNYEHCCIYEWNVFYYYNLLRDYLFVVLELFLDPWRSFCWWTCASLIHIKVFYRGLLIILWKYKKRKKWKRKLGNCGNILKDKNKNKYKNWNDYTCIFI